MSKLTVLKPLPSYRAIVTPLERDDWHTGAKVAVVDLRNHSEVKATSFAWRQSCEPGRPIDEWWADVTINRVRLRIPIEFSNTTRPGGVALGREDSPLWKHNRGRRKWTPAENQRRLLGSA